MCEIRLNLFGDASIQIGEEAIGPAAPHLFALLLLLTLAPGDGVSRQDIKELLFGRADERMAAQRLRQLLYRLRQLGVRVDDTTGGALRVENPVVELPAAYNGDAGALRALPHYRPRLPKAFLAWLDQTRERLERRSQAMLVRELREAHRRQDWSSTSGLATVLLAADPLNEEVAAAGVESKAMLGHRDEALELADRFVREVEGDEAAAAPMRRLRARIARTSLVRREGTLRGREECLQLLADQWERAAEGGGRLCVVLGPAGMGKTRVAETFVAKIRLSGGRVVTYRCDRQASQHPLALFSAVLPELQAMPGSLGVSPENRVALERLGPSTIAPNGELPGLAEAEARRAELQRALIDLLEAVSGERPLLLIVDDLHLLDEASSDVLRTLADSDNEAAVLVAGFSRPRSDSGTRLTGARRATSYVLPPLTDAQAHDLLLELRAGRPLTPEQQQWTLSQANGNPFYVHALSSETTEHGSLPAHVRSMATCAYFALSPSARTVLEACLLLETLATLGRVRSSSGLDDSLLLRALRELEEADLVRLNAHSLRGPHAILDEALREIIPGSVTALLHVRIAETLAEECANEGFSMSLAWAAVQSWLAAGNPRAAVSLACRSARKTVELGEPQTGADLLSQIPRTGLPLECQRELLDDLHVIARAGNCQSLVVGALQDRAQLALALRESGQVLAGIKLKTIANASLIGETPDRLTDLTSILHDESLPSATRTEAGKLLVAIADWHLEPTIANDTYTYLCSAFGSSECLDPSYLSAMMIYHTVFGKVEHALALTGKTGSLDAPSIDNLVNAFSNNAALALFRLGYFEHAKELATNNFQRTHAKGLLRSAELSLTTITDSELALGDIESATRHVAELETIASRRWQYENRHVTGYFSSKFFVLLHNSQFAKAAAHLAEYAPSHFLAAPRHGALMHAYALILAYRSGRGRLSETAIQEVRTAYERGRSLGGQDACVEALWCCYSAQGQTREASELLLEYLTFHRRERGLPEWSLRNATAADPAWQDFRQRL